MIFSLPSFAEAKAAGQGFLRVARLDAEFRRWFDPRPEGALRAFTLILPILPISVAALLIDYDLPSGADWHRVIPATVIVNVLSWVLFPLILFFIGHSIDRKAEIPGAVNFYYWLNAGFTLVSFCLAILTYLGPFGEYPNTLGAALWFLMYFFEGWAFRHLLRLSIGGAFLLAMLDFTISIGLIGIWTGLTTPGQY